MVMIIRTIKKCSDSEELEEEKREYKLEHVDNDSDKETKARNLKKVMSRMADMVKQDSEGREKYLSTHGHHFNDKAAKHAISRMVTKEGKTYSIPMEKVLEILKQEGITMSVNMTAGDALYLSNKIRHAHSTDTVKSDAHCIHLAIECLNDPNSEEGEAFQEWVDRMDRQKQDIPWHEFE